ncbi:MAG: hypothetical protein L0H23_02290 [Luteimonas sp.]|nr:hypothetical protein [Luteimonas sp.]
MKNPDYNHLYLELGLQPGCGVDELRHAYRRHVAGLHPDRGEPDQRRDHGSLSLPDLNALYGEAIRFQQRHGRLPGAPQPVLVRASTPTPPALASVDAVSSPGDAPVNPGRRLWLALLLIAAVIAGLVLGSPDTSAPVVVPGNTDAAPGAAASPSMPSPTRLALGMDAATVLSIQGEPVGKSDVEWTYGPSWLRFEKGKLTDWYSSQLHPLRTRSTRPPLPAATEPPVGP